LTEQILSEPSYSYKYVSFSYKIIDIILIFHQTLLPSHLKLIVLTIKTTIGINMQLLHSVAIFAGLIATISAASTGRVLARDALATPNGVSAPVHNDKSSPKYLG
jgi:hypothetical protein